MKHKLTWSKLFATVGGAGWLPVAPGTWGAAVGVVSLLPFLNKTGMAMLPVLLPGAVALTWLGAIVAHRLAPEWGEDPKPFVMDEFVGLWVSLIGHVLNWQNLLVGFVLFRIFDILKPLGIRKLEDVPKGWGVMLDDVGAGIATNVLLWGLHFAML